MRNKLNLKIREINMNLRMIATLLVSALTIGASASSAVAGDYSQGETEGKIYGPVVADTSVWVCNFADDTIVTYFTDETQFEHGLAFNSDTIMPCDLIKTNYSYVGVWYDSSFDDGNLFQAVELRNNEVLLIERDDWGDLTHTVENLRDLH